MSGAGVRREALREIAKEKAIARGKVSSEPRLEEEDKRKQEIQQQKEPQEEGMVFKQASPKDVILENRRDDDSSFSWKPFAPWKKEKEKSQTLNTATIWCMAKKMIAQEWREARGIKKRDTRVEFLEQEAAMWEEKREAEREKQEEAKVRFEKQKEKFDEALKIIGRKVLDEKNNLSSKGATTLIEDAMGAIGKVYDVEWRSDGCDIWIEPWEERWSRQKMGETLPNIYRIKINDELEMVSYDLIEDEDVMVRMEKETSANQLDESLDEETLGGEEEDVKVLLEKKIAEVGRLVELKKWREDSWIVIVEPWARMRIRNVERKGEGPIETERILARVVDGTIITSPAKENKSWEKKEGGNEDAS